MMIDYINRLKQLKEDRMKYEKSKDRTHYKDKLNKQESKYQTYIIEQINQKNKLIAASKIQNIINAQINTTTLSPFQNIYHYQQQNISEEANDSFNSKSGEETISVNFILVKLSTDVIKRLLTKVAVQNVRTTFIEIQRFSKRKRTLEKTAKIIQNYYLRHSFRKLTIYDCKQSNQPQLQGKIFDQSFSLIHKCGQKERRGAGGMSESYLSFIMDKQANIQQDYQSMQIIARQKEQIQSLQEDLSYLRNLLAEKNIQLKKKSEQLNQLHQNQQNSYASQNTSYCNSLQRELTGQKRIRKNTSHLSNSSPSLKGQEISRELLSKYMKESFQMKQTIDLARERCLQIHSKLKPQQKKELEGLIKILTLGEQESVIDQV